jgi:hypothetical protein
MKKEKKKVLTTQETAKHAFGSSSGWFRVFLVVAQLKKVVEGVWILIAYKHTSDFIKADQETSLGSRV